jgi:hypothetical protein
MPRLHSVLLLCVLFAAASIVPAAGAEVARVVLTQQALPDGGVRITATVTDVAGKAAQGADVTFRVRTVFGWVKLAQGEADGRGTASVVLPAAAPYPEVTAEAGEGTARAGQLLRQVNRRDLTRRPGPEILRNLSPQAGFISPYPPIQIVFVAVILGGIWTTYAYLVSLLIGLHRVR